MPEQRSRVQLFVGKGGVGTTTLAAATAVSAATDGARVLLVSIDQAGSLADVLGVPNPRTTTSLTERLDVRQLDTSALLEDKFRGLSGLLDACRNFRSGRSRTRFVVRGLGTGRVDGIPGHPRHARARRDRRPLGQRRLRPRDRGLSGRRRSAADTRLAVDGVGVSRAIVAAAQADGRCDRYGHAAAPARVRRRTRARVGGSDRGSPLGSGEHRRACGDVGRRRVGRGDSSDVVRAGSGRVAS